jgi:hypothetical protein
MENNDNIRRPDLVEGWVSEIQETKKKYGAYRLFPWWLTFFCAVGVLISFRISDLFWTKPDQEIPFFVGILTVDGLLLAFSWSSFVKIYEAACAPNFGVYLRRNGLLVKYFFHIDYIHITQVVSVTCAAPTLVITIIEDIPLWGKRIATTLTIATMMYALKCALAAVRIMQDIVWYRAIFDGSMSDRTADIVRVRNGVRDR